MANQLVMKIAEKVWVETEMGRLEDWIPFAEYAVNEVIAAQQSVQADVPYAPVKHPFACPECGRIGQVVCDNTARR